MVRIFLGREAFQYYFGESLYEWALHAFEFSFVPISLLVADTSLLDAFLPVRLILRMLGGIETNKNGI